MGSSPRKGLERGRHPLCAAALFLVACSSPEALVGYNRSDVNGGSSQTTTSGGALGLGGESSAGGASSGCTDGGPLIELPTGVRCTSDLAKRVFLFAICTCSDLSANGTLATDSLDSLDTLSLVDPDLGGSVGVNGAYRAAGSDALLNGSLWVAGDADFGEHDIRGDLQCGGSLTARGESRVDRSASVAGEVSAPALSIGGALYTPEPTPDVLSVDGGIFTQEVAVSAPCDCQDPIDIAAATQHFESHNDNAVEGVARSALAAVEEEIELTLPCGQYYFDSIGGTGVVTLHLTGKTVIAVGEGLSNSAGLTFDLAPAAELDVFIAGDVELSGPIRLGLPDRPAATRLYIGGRVALSSDVAMYANWYVPHHPITLSAESELWGSIYSQSLEISGRLLVHYDRAILKLPSCNPPRSSCGSCRDCANPTPACRDGQCDVCQEDSDCCPPLRCSQGQCGIDTVIR